MPRQTIAYTDHYAGVMKALTSRGLLLAAHDPKGRANAMTIGWGVLGSVWGIPQWIVLVRPSRYTYECIEHSRAFSVNVPGADLDEACALCGSKSGRDGDKLTEARLAVEKAGRVNAPVLPQCPIIYECAVIHYGDVVPAHLDAEVCRSCYPGGDYHRLYFGKIVSATAVEDAAKALAG